MKQNRGSLFLFLSAALLIAAGCQKVSPEVFLLNGGSASKAPITPDDPKAGRVTMGSDDVPQTSSGGYKLKGRVSFVESGTSVSSGGYKLQGTVKF